MEWIKEMGIYIVKQFDNVDEIAAITGVPAEQIIRQNQLVYPYELAVGQALFIENRTKMEDVEEKTYLMVGGYAYPFISRWVLQQTLPFLSELLIFSYGFDEEGNLLHPVLEDTWMVELAKRYGVRGILTLTPFGRNGTFNNHLIHTIVSNPSAAQNLWRQLLTVMAEKGYDGLDIDFEYILATDRDAFSAFVEETTQVMHQYGYTVSIALAPKTSASQKGLLYEGKDYRALGKAVDHVLLMTYEWGYKYGPPMAVAPLHMVRKVVEYAITEIPNKKIHLGIPNYGYDWPLPFIEGVTSAKTIGNIEAVRIAIAQGVPIQFDVTAQSPWFTYHENGIIHEVWFEDVRSLQGKFNLIKEYQLGGCGYWTIMQFFYANWLLLNENFWIN